MLSSACRSLSYFTQLALFSLALFCFSVFDYLKSEVHPNTPFFFIRQNWLLCLCTSCTRSTNCYLTGVENKCWNRSNTPNRCVLKNDLLRTLLRTNQKYLWAMLTVHVIYAMLYKHCPNFVWIMAVCVLLCCVQSFCLLCRQVIIGALESSGDIVSVSCCENEIFVLKGDRDIIRLSNSPEGLTSKREYFCYYV